MARPGPPEAAGLAFGFPEVFSGDAVGEPDAIIGEEELEAVGVHPAGLHLENNGLAVSFSNCVIRAWPNMHWQRFMRPKASLRSCHCGLPKPMGWIPICRWPASP